MKTTWKNNLRNHFEKNSKKYIALFIAFIVGVFIGTLTLKGLAGNPKNEVLNYFKGFTELFKSQNVDSNAVFKISFFENLKFVVILWILGVTIIGIPLIYITVCFKGYITGFTSAVILESLGGRGILLLIFIILIKDLIYTPFIIGIGVNGINFSFHIINRKKLVGKEKRNLRQQFFSYSLITCLFFLLIIVGMFYEAYILPNLAKIIVM